MTIFEKDAINTDSKISSMRIAFFYMIKLIIILSSATVAAKFVFSYLEKPFDLTGIVALIAALGVVAFGGKAAQAFSEPSNLVSNIAKSIAPDKGNDPNGK